jgi:anti-sigma regulatory factor (Ser/Thr protein kinase)
MTSPFWLFNTWGVLREVDDMLKLNIRNDLAEISRVNEALDALAGQEESLTEQAVVATKIVLEELLSNVIKYGLEEGNPREIEIEIKVAEGQITATIVDDGEEFDPFEVPAPDTDQAIEDRQIGGLGIHIVRQMMDSVTYERVDNKNVVTVGKFLKRKG